MAKYRVVKDAYCGFEVQVRYWFWPFWLEPDPDGTWSPTSCNTSVNLESAQKRIERMKAPKVIWEEGK